jgi:hypothetical protein
MNNFSRSSSAPLGQSSSADCSDFYLEAEATQFYRPAPQRQPNSGLKRGIWWGLALVLPFWAVVILIVLNSMK